MWHCTHLGSVVQSCFSHLLNVRLLPFPAITFHRERLMDHNAALDAIITASQGLPASAAPRCRRLSPELSKPFKRHPKHHYRTPHGTAAFPPDHLVALAQVPLHLVLPSDMEHCHWLIHFCQHQACDTGCPPVPRRCKKRD